MLEGQLAPDIHTLISIAARARGESLAEGTDPVQARAQRLAEVAYAQRLCEGGRRFWKPAAPCGWGPRPGDD